MPQKLIKISEITIVAKVLNLEKITSDRPRTSSGRKDGRWAEKTRDLNQTQGNSAGYCMDQATQAFDNL
jgi:hypothetical protein